MELILIYSVKLEKILEVFWRIHDPTTLNRQGADTGTQYRSGIYYENEAQKKAAETNTAGATLSELKNMNTKLDEIISILKNKPDLSKIKKIETTYSLENANALLKEGWILLELFKDEKGFLGYRLGASF